MKTKMKILTIRLGDEDLERLERIKVKYRTKSMSHAVRLMVEDAVKTIGAEAE